MDPLRKGIAIGMLFGSEGRTATNLIESKTINENGTYSAVYEIDPETGEVYDPPKDGYETVVISLPIYNKRVALTTSDVTDSQTAIFEYDPQDETPTPWEGYLYFTIDLSGVKRDINDLLDQISALEDELEDCHDCRDEVVAALQRYDPDYDPAEGECPSDKVDEVVDEVGNLQDEVEACHDCKDEVIAAIQQYVPSFTPDPTTCNIPDGVDDVYEQGKEDAPEKYTFEPNPDDPDYPDDIMVIANGANVTDETTGVTLGVEITLDEQNRGTAYPYYTSGDTKYYMGGVSANFVSYWGEHNIKVIDPTTGEYSGGARAYWTYGGSSWFPFGGTQAELIGYGDPTHSYTISK